MRPIVKSFLDEGEFLELKNVAKEAREKQEGDYCNTFGRFWIHGHYLLQKIHKTIALEYAKHIFGENIKPSYSGLSLYCAPWAVCPPHYDRPQCKYSLDLCVEKVEDWPLFVENKSYSLNENCALAYSGTNDFHWREKAKGQQYLTTMAFFHFVDSDFTGSLD
jgi:hypothetical protein